MRFYSYYWPLLCFLDALLYDLGDFSLDAFIMSENDVQGSIHLGLNPEGAWVQYFFLHYKGLKNTTTQNNSNNTLYSVENDHYSNAWNTFKPLQNAVNDNVL